MIALFDFCSLHWILPWLLPFLLGLGLGWLLWGKFKSMVADLESEINNLKVRIRGLEGDLEACKSARLEAEGNVSLLKGRIREMEASIAAQGDKGTVSVSNTEKASFTAPVAPSVSVATGASSGDDKWLAAIGDNKLQIVEGIGPKMEEVLHANGIKTFSALAAATPSSLRDILNKYGDKYKIIDPTTWPAQAKLAGDRKWNDLIQLQKTLDTGRSDTATDGNTDSKLEKWLIKAGVIRRWAQDDLKAVEGIGPKIEELLHNAGIKTWRALSETPVSKIQQILDAAGSKYALAVPGTWPQQAGLAADGKWDELQALQDSLNAGK